jgi:tRNA pseudouridine32 synthase / 23S rRNA pseudouridine746 synthase
MVVTKTARGAFTSAAVSPSDGTAQSRLRVRERFDDRTLISLTRITGRTNQLRLHCLHIGHPIFGDVLYSGAPAPRLCLHAERLSFQHPVTAERLRFERTGLSIVIKFDPP